MTEWILVLLVWSATGDTTPAGKVLGGLPTEAACWQRAKADTPRMRKLYPPDVAKQVQWLCVKRDDPAMPGKTSPSV